MLDHRGVSKLSDEEQPRAALPLTSSSRLQQFSSVTQQRKRTTLSLP
jgi:hypothetical protein